MQSEQRFDSIDRRLVRLLQANARLTREELGEAVGLSGPAVHQRIRRLEADGVITGYHARVDAARVGRAVHVFVRVWPGPATDVARLLRGWEAASDVLACHRLGSDGGFLLRLGLTSFAELGRHLDALRRADCRTSAEPVLETVFERWLLPAGPDADYL